MCIRDRPDVSGSLPETKAYRGRQTDYGCSCGQGDGLSLIHIYLLREMIESGVIRYGEAFKESMEKGDWDLSKVE